MKEELDSLEKNQQSQEPDGDDATKDAEVSVPEVLDKAPPEIKELFLGMSHMVGPLPNPLLKTIKPEHITKLIESNDSETKMVYDDAKEERSHKLIIFIITILLLWHSSSCF